MIDRSIATAQVIAEVYLCDDEELEALHRMVVAIRKRRELLEAQLVDHRRERVDRVQAHRTERVLEGLRELRDATTYSAPRPSLFVVRDDDEPSNPQP